MSRSFLFFCSGSKSQKHVLRPESLEGTDEEDPISALEWDPLSTDYLLGQANNLSNEGINMGQITNGVFFSNKLFYLKFWYWGWQTWRFGWTVNRSAVEPHVLCSTVSNLHNGIRLVDSEALACITTFCFPSAAASVQCLAWVPSAPGMFITGGTDEVLCVSVVLTDGFCAEKHWINTRTSGARMRSGRHRKNSWRIVYTAEEAESYC